MPCPHHPDKFLVSKNFDNAAHTYDRHAVIQKQAAYMLCDIASPYLPQNNDALVCELGCGTGFITGLLVEKYHYKKYIAIDISYNMLRNCQKFHKNNIAYINADITSMQYRKSFDVIISGMTLHWINDISAIITKLFKQCKLLVFSIPLEGSFSEISNALNNIHPVINQFPSLKALHKILEELQCSYELQTRYITNKFDCIYDFMLHLKRTGANTLKGSGNIILPRNIITKKQTIHTTQITAMCVVLCKN